MKQWLSIAFTCFLATQSAVAFSLSNTQALQPQVQQSQAARLAAEVFSRYHYKPVKLNDTSSNKIFNKYLKSLDSEHLFFLQEDISQFTYARTKLDNALLEENLTIPFSIFNLYKQRVSERIEYAKSLLNQPFDFTLVESYQYEREDVAWATDKSELNDIWRKRVKNDWLRLKIAGKEKASIIKTLSKRYDNSLSSINKIKSNDVFQSFMNAYATSIDPHTSYFGVRAAEDFNISMRLSLVGIGAVLQSKDEYTVIRELVTGGPAASSGLLKVGDRIVGVAQGKEAPMVEVLGWRLDDTVDLIRGEQDSTVVLAILPADAGLDAPHKNIVLVRDKINLEQQAAKKSVIDVKSNPTSHKIGVIELPVFYQDFFARQKGDENFKSATRDVRNLINELKAEKVDSILIDLRNNGGGSLDEAIDLTGLFIDQGPILQERDVEGGIKVDSDTDSGVAWDGPLGVLINRGSASASEIFAAAIQDYGRGLIIGELTYGKGTVQTVINLDRIAKNDQPKFGEIKMTVAQFFRINGGTTQLRGVIPDIKLPSLNDITTFGESSYKNALPWSSIKPANFRVVHDFKKIIPKLTAKHALRISADQDFINLNQDIDTLNVQRQKKMITLNEVERRQERKVQADKLSARKKLSENDKVKNNAQLDDGLLASERNLDNELVKEKDAKDEKDILLNEAAHILSDSILLISESHQQLVANPKR
jgi:carboxyl-terminal processing protease